MIEKTKIYGMTVILAGITILLLALSLIIQTGDLSRQLFSTALWFGISTILLLIYSIYTWRSSS